MNEEFDKMNGEQKPESEMQAVPVMPATPVVPAAPLTMPDDETTATPVTAPMQTAVAEETPIAPVQQFTPVQQAAPVQAEPVAIPVATPITPVATPVQPIAPVAPVQQAAPVAEPVAAPIEETVDEALALDLKEVQTLIGQHYNKVLALLKYNKEKDANINKLTKQMNEYRDGFASGLLKSIAMNVIGYREDCRKSLRTYLERDMSLEDVKKNFRFLYQGFEDILYDMGIEQKGDVWTYNKRDINAEIEKPELEEISEPTYPVLAEKELKKTADVSAYLQECEQLIADTLRCDKVLVEQLGQYIEYSSWYEKGLHQAVVYPIIRKLTKIYKNLFDACQKWTASDVEEDVKREYFKEQVTLIERLDGVLEYQCNVTIETVVEGDEYDVRKHRLLKTVETQDASLNRKVAKVYRDCYFMGDKVIMPAKT